MAETQVSIVYVDDNTVKYNFFNTDNLTWAFSSFTDITTIQGTIIDIDMDAYVKGLENVIKYHLASEGLK